MRKFRCKVTRIDEYEVELDENIFNQEFIEHFKKYFFDYETLEEHAKHIAQFRARFGERFIEGYGIPKVNGKLPFIARINKKDLESVNHGLNINILNEDNDCEVEVEEIQDN
jgi:hypothetical protein